jgi:hypothetical protein
VSDSAPRFPPRALILYEDSRTAAGGFGLHDFVLANVLDVIQERQQSIEPQRLRKLIAASPKKSDTKVLSALERDAERLHNGVTVLVVWLDDDKLHRPLGLSSRQPPAVLTEAVRQRLPASLRSEAVWIHLVRGNLEELLRRIDGAQPGTLDQATLDGALDKDLTARDLCFKEASRAKHAAWRRLVRDGDPSFGETIQHLAALVTRETWPPW